jgi:hypothetical protein
MKIKTFRGQLDMGVEEQIRLSTNDGLTGYKINKFQIMSSTPGVGNVELIAQIYKTEDVANINTTPDFSNNRLLAVVYYQDNQADHYAHSSQVIFDNEIFNQDIFINITDAGGYTVPANYYIELEQMKLDLNESTYITIKNIRSRTQV